MKRIHGKKSYFSLLGEIFLLENSKLSKKFFKKHPFFLLPLLYARVFKTFKKMQRYNTNCIFVAMRKKAKGKSFGFFCFPV